ncbi:MAG: FAD-dependent oxidoreductase [Myxococcales bacterium]
MSEATTLTGPDLTEGVDAQGLQQGIPLLGHAHGEAVMLVKTVDEILAVGATCTHYGGPLAEGLVVGDTVRCPWHHACFNLRSGAVARAPALNPIACYGVHVEGSRIRVTGRLPAPPHHPAALDPAIKTIIIVGGGAAGHNAAETLRARGYGGRVMLLGRDIDVPYDRPNLSKDYLAGSAPEEWIPLRPEAFYREHDITLEKAIEVTTIDGRARQVALSDGRTLPYDRLLLATGAEPVPLAVPGGGAPFVHTLRTWQDCRRIVGALGGARRVVIVGSGFIGLEAAAALRTRGCEVAVVSPEAEPLARVVGARVGAFLRELHQQHGVTFHLGQTVTSIDSGNVVTAAGLRLPAELVLVAIGVRPAVGLAERAGIAVDRGVLVNEYLETSVPGIFAAGDVARFPDPRAGGAGIRVEHWVVAQRMGAVAAANMLGQRRKFDDVPFFWSVHYDVTLSYVGHTESAAETLRITIDGSLADRDCRVTYSDGARLAAVLTVGRDRESLAAERAFELVR